VLRSCLPTLFILLTGKFVICSFVSFRVDMKEETLSGKEDTEVVNIAAKTALVGRDD